MSVSLGVGGKWTCGDVDNLDGRALDGEGKYSFKLEAGRVLRIGRGVVMNLDKPVQMKKGSQPHQVRLGQQDGEVEDITRTAKGVSRYLYHGGSGSNTQGYVISRRQGRWRLAFVLDDPGKYTPEIRVCSAVM